MQIRKAGAGQLHRDDDAEIAEQADHVTGPADRDHRRCKSVLKQQQRAHDPGGEFADRRVAVGVGRAGDRQGRGKLRIAESRKRADHARHQEGQQHRGTGVQRGGVAGAHEDARADDATDAQEHEVPRPERALELAGFGFPLHLLYAFAHHEACKKTSTGSTCHQFSP